MNITLYEYLKKAAALEPLTTEDKAELAAVLGNKAVMKLIAVVNAEANAVVEGALGWNLMGPNGVADAANAQGRARGLKRALDIIWEASGRQVMENEDGGQ